MAWTETDPMKERLHFVADWDRRLYTVTELCARYGVSRKTGYKWLARYADVGVAGLAERSRAPHRCPHRIAPAVAAAIVEARRQHPSRSEEHTSELQSQSNLVCRLLLEKKKNKNTRTTA